MLLISDTRPVEHAQHKFSSGTSPCNRPGIRWTDQELGRRGLAAAAEVAADVCLHGIRFKVSDFLKLVVQSSVGRGWIVVRVRVAVVRVRVALSIA
jgi:hypothetical protein